ncbi:MAG: nucleotidyltransferase domain-containing protein [Candidatus Scalindua sp.]|nr:nucleotidyltransferase domain-containing protein [Candidatus Scalindua sp.]NOG84000.1 nucleotidyltransferase domain-containing protein [Planctomycetota bacterium]GJQ60522.1 MAG: DNA polymerase beta domain-containing protein [Candidatus Scalindua sp.]
MNGDGSVLEKSRPVISVQDFSLSDIISFLQEKLAKRDITSCFLFGSLALNETTPWSDIDILIITETEKAFIERPLDYQELFDLGVSLDIIVYTPEEFEKVKMSASGFSLEMQKKMIQVL